MCECPKAFTGIQFNGDAAIARRMTCKSYSCPVCGPLQRKQRVRKATPGFQSHDRWQAVIVLDQIERDKYTRYLRDHGLQYACVRYRVQTEWEDYTVYQIYHHAIPDGLRKKTGKVMTGSQVLEHFTETLDQEHLHSVRFSRRFPVAVDSRNRDGKWSLVGISKLSIRLIEQILRERLSDTTLDITRPVPVFKMQLVMLDCVRSCSVEFSQGKNGSIGRTRRNIVYQQAQEHRKPLVSLRE